MAFTTAIVSLLATGVGYGLQAKAQYEQGKSQKKILERNAAQREADARAREMESIAKQKQARVAGRKQIARNKMIFFGRGLEASGSPLEILAEDTGNLEMQISEIGRQDSNDAARMRNQAKMDRWQGAEAFKAGGIASQGTVLQGLAQTASMTSNYRSIGTF